METQSLVEQYIRFWSRLPTFAASHVVELGMYQGGSTAFWFEVLQPVTMIGIERNLTDVPYFNRYVAGLKGRLLPYWGIDQSDRPNLRRIVMTELGGRVDLVLDDASHVYEPTRAAFEVLFPAMPPGGLYIIEDWAWAHWPQYYDAFGSARDLTELTMEVVEATGTSSTGPVASVTVMQGFVCIERGPAVIANPDQFSLEEWIERRPPKAWRHSKATMARIKSALRPFVNAIRR